jgi:hypothetical protein
LKIYHLATPLVSSVARITSSSLFRQWKQLFFAGENRWANNRVNLYFISTMRRRRRKNSHTENCAKASTIWTPNPFERN